MRNLKITCFERNLFPDFQFRKTMAIVLLMCFTSFGIMQVSAQRAPLTFSKGRIALSHDGNSYDEDDFLAVAMQWGIFTAYGVQDKVVHWGICDNMHLQELTKYKEELISGEGWKYFSGWKDPSTFLFDLQSQLPAGLANFKKEAEKSTIDDPLYFICAGPMEAPWRMINNVAPQFRKYITCISHSTWNETFSETNSTHTWLSMKNDFTKDGVKFVDLGDQNKYLGTDRYDFNWLKTMPAGTCINPSAFSWIATRDKKGEHGKGKWDCSDAGMVLYLLTGVDYGTGPAIKELFLNPICTTTTKFTISATAGSNGSISPSGSATVNSGASQSFAITPNSGFQIDVLTIDGVSKPITNPYNFANVTANHSIAVTFKVAKVQYAITATAGANGSISPSGSVLVDSLASQTYSITPNSCSVIEDVKVDGISQGAISSYTFTNVTAIHTISATFKSKQYTITASAGTNGSISPSGTILVNCGANTCFTVVPNSGYIIDTVFVDGISQGAATCINNITSNHTISATFKVADQPVSAITGWVSGTNNTKEVGSNRLMVVMVMGESKSSFGANGVTYGGQPMTKQTDKMYFVSGNRSYASIFTLNEAGVNAATSGAIAVTWSATPSVGNSIYSVLLSNVDQTTSVSTSLNNALTGTSIATATTLAAATGDMAIMCGATENNVIQTFNNGFIKQFETNSTWGDGVGGYKLGTGINETPKFTQSTSGRMAICALVVKKVSSFISPSRTSKNIQTTNAEVNGIRVYPNPVSDILYVDFAGVEASREIKVFDMEGQLLHRIKTSNSIVQIDVKSLKIKGIVMLQVIEGGTVSSHRVIIN